MRKIHITESQLAILKKTISESNGNVVNIDATPQVQQKGASQGLKDAKTTAQNAGVEPDEANFTVNGSALKSGIYEDYSDTVDRDSPDYYEVENYLNDMIGTPLYNSILNSLYGYSSDALDVLNQIDEYFGGSINRGVIYAALNDFKRKIRSERLEVNYPDIAESKVLTKKQIKEARLANLRRDCIVYKKGDLK